MKYIRLLPLAFSFAYGVKCLILQANLFDVATIAIFATVGVVLEYLHFKNSTLISTKEIDILNGKLKEIEKNTNDVKTHVSGLQLGTQIRYGKK